jgi:hypothetical protein
VAYAHLAAYRARLRAKEADVSGSGEGLAQLVMLRQVVNGMKNTMYYV